MNESMWEAVVHQGINITPKRFQCLKKANVSFEALYYFSAIDMQNLGLDTKTLESWRKFKVDFELGKWQKLWHRFDLQNVVFDTSDYPFLLSMIPSPPAQLLLRGDVALLQGAMISIVGSRGISSYGEQVLKWVMPDIATRGLTVVSGLAYGVDIMAHKLAVEQGLKTVAVLAHGLDEIYPAAHKVWAEKEIERGNLLLVSEYAFGVPARPEFFPARNRIVSGLSKATIIVEARKKSGSLVTAQLALEQNREVLAIPGSLFHKGSEGPLDLLKNQSATPLVDLSQLNEWYGDAYQQNQVMPLLFDVSESQKNLLVLLQQNPEIHVDDLARLLQQPVNQVSADLTILELSCYVIHHGNEKYSALA